MHALCTVYMLFSSRIGDIRRLQKVHAVGRNLVRSFMVGSPALYSSPVGDAVNSTVVGEGGAHFLSLFSQTNSLK